MREHEPTERQTEFDFVSEFTIVRTKILEKRKGRIVLNLKTLDDVVLLPLILFEASDGFSRLSPRFTSFTVYNSTGVYKIPQSIEYYQGHVSSREDDSHVHGTLYKDRTFEGVIKLTSRTIYLEAVDRHKPWAHDQSVMYDKDDVAAFSEGLTNFPDMPSGFQTRQHLNIKSMKDLYRKYHYTSTAKKRGKSSRGKRQTDEEQIRYCNIHAVVDGYFTHYMANDDKQESAKLIAQFVQNVHEIFLAQDFDGNSLPDNVGVVLSALTFIDKVFGFNYLITNKKPEQFLSQFTDNYQFPGVCAAAVFTFQDFGATLGMAWVAKSSRPATTGIGSPKNHGIITTLLYGRRVPTRVTQLTLAHELGHSFGSSHDPFEPGNQCAPSAAQGGKYIMFHTTSQGNMPNNYEFSPCSKNVIAIVLGTRPRVLRSYEAPYCGNSLIEKGEECDCGTPLSCKSLDQCCTPAGQENQCLLRRDHGAVCSPAVHSCCTDNCKIMGIKGADACGGFDECKVLTYCDGEHFTCPVAPSKPNGTLCRGGTHLCEAGDCLKSVCEVAGLSNCMCASITDACNLCCTNHSNPEPSCKPANGYLWFTENNYDIAVWLQPGSLCMENTGYCSADNLCMKPGIDYVSLALAGRHLNKWFDNNWYTVTILMFLVLAIFTTFLCTQESRKSNNSSAFRAGHISRVIHECRRQHRMLNEEIAKLNLTTRLFECGQLDLATGITRLMLLFPVTTSHTLYRVMVNSANEAGAVKKLILMRQPMIGDCTTYKALKSEMKDPTTVGKTNEQFYGKLMATVKDLTQLTDSTRAALGITTPSPTRAKKMLARYQKRLLKGVAHAFNKPL